MQLSPNVRFARNVVIGMAAFILLVGAAMVILEPGKWQDYVPMFAAGAFTLGIARQVNRGEGGWTDTVHLPRIRGDRRARPEVDVPTATLLRAADAPGDGTLLRPAQATGDTPEERLLRPASRDEAES